jgi:AcrR family transcriptional regulator
LAVTEEGVAGVPRAAAAVTRASEITVADRKGSGNDGAGSRSRSGNEGAGPRSRKGAETRARLVEAAKQVFERDGFLDARIIDISKTAGLSHGSFYHYFDSKEQIFREIAEAQEVRLTAAPEVTAAPTRKLSARERIERANRHYLELYRDEARIMGVIEQVSRYDDHVNAARFATQKHFVERAEKAIRQLQVEGLADENVHPSIAADALGAMVARFAELWLVQGYREYDFDEAVEQLTLLWVNALGLRDRPRPGARRRTTKAT